MLEIIHQLEQIDTEVFLFFNGMHCELFDYFMMIVSHRFAWIPFYAAFIWVMIVNFHWKVTLTTILAVALLVLLCDQTASGLLKPMVERLRPSNLDNPISPMVHVVNEYRGGRYGFPSSHSANSWGVTFFAMLIGFVMASLVFWIYQHCFKAYAIQFYEHKERLKQDYIPITTGIVCFATMLMISVVMCYI